MSRYDRILASVGAIILGCWILAALSAPWLATFAPGSVSTPLAATGIVASDGSVFWLGTDHAGRDVFSEVIWSARAELFLVAGAVLLVYLFGLPIALAATARHKALSMTAGGLVAVARAVPVFVSYVVLITAIGASSVNFAVVLLFAALPNLTDNAIAWRKAQDMEEAERLGHWRVVVWIVVDALRRMAFYTAIAECLGFLGLGPWLPTVPGFGWMVAEARNWLLVYPHLVFSPIAAFCLLLLGLNLLAGGLQSLVPPALRSTDPARPSYRAAASRQL